MIWYFIIFPIVAVVAVVLKYVLRSPKFKGMVGELIVNTKIKNSLDKKIYHLIKNVILPIEDGSTQIDHIVVSKYGIFVIETKNMKGWIFGKSDEGYWTQKNYRQKKTFPFQNPLRQNDNHVKALESLLGINNQHIFSVIAFVGNSTFKTEMLENVTEGIGFIRFIKSKKEPVLTETEVNEIIRKVEINSFPIFSKANREHVKHVKSKREDKKCQDMP